MAKNRVVDFTWDIREELRKAEIRAREDICDTLNRNLVGRQVKIHCFERVGLNAKPELKEQTCFIDSIDVNSEGYSIVILTDKGKKLIPHPPLGIEVLEDES